jgi:ubiquinone/menaquinone biosynthesis C-methylase UbiE
MEQSYPGKLSVWEGWGTSADPPVALERALQIQATPDDIADELYANESLNFYARSPRAGEGPETFSLQWFLDIENRRLTRHGAWLSRLLEYKKHTSETVLGIGNGLGTDWVQYARHGANVVACSPTPSRLALVRRNFELRGLTARFVSAGTELLPLESASIDVVCVSSWLEPVGNSVKAVSEIYRVLKPGGKVLAMAPAKYDASFWLRLLAPWRRWFGRQQHYKFPGATLSARRLHKLFAPFVEHRIYKRQLRRREIPLAWRLLPLNFLQRILGRMLIIKAFKPLSAAISVPLAA